MPLRRSFPKLARPAHGGVESNQAAGLASGGQVILDFSANPNPLGPSAMVKKALVDFDPSLYPDLTNRRLTEAIAAQNGVLPGRVVPGAGSTELIYLIAQAFIQKGDRVMIFAPTFGEYEFACRLNLARVSLLTSLEENEFQWPLSLAEKKIKSLKPVLVFLCNPNNPTGVYLPTEQIERLARLLSDGLLIVDEAYASFSNHAREPERLLAHRNVVILRSMTKDFALAGLRLGYTLSSERIARIIRLYQPTWSVSAAVQIAGVAALSDPAHLKKAEACVLEGRAYLRQALEKLGFKVFPSEANFLLVKVGNGLEFRSKLLGKGIFVRDCASFGLPQFIRISVRTLPECQRLVAAMREVIANG